VATGKFPAYPAGGVIYRMCAGRFGNLTLYYFAPTGLSSVVSRTLKSTFLCLMAFCSLTFGSVVSAGLIDFDTKKTRFTYSGLMSLSFYKAPTAVYRKSQLRYIGGMKTQYLQDTLREWRHDFHRHPELGFEEHRTSEQVVSLLTSFGIETHRGIGKTGVVGV